MANGKTFIVFAAVKTDSARVAEEMLKHPSLGLGVTASTNEEIIRELLASINNNDQEPSCIGFRLEVSEITQI